MQKILCALIPHYFLDSILFLLTVGSRRFMRRLPRFCEKKQI